MNEESSSSDSIETETEESSISFKQRTNKTKSVPRRTDMPTENDSSIVEGKSSIDDKRH